MVCSFSSSLDVKNVADFKAVQVSIPGKRNVFVLGGNQQNKSLQGWHTNVV